MFSLIALSIACPVSVVIFIMVFHLAKNILTGIPESRFKNQVKNYELTYPLMEHLTFDSISWSELLQSTLIMLTLSTWGGFKVIVSGAAIQPFIMATSVKRRQTMYFMSLQVEVLPSYLKKIWRKSNCSGKINLLHGKELLSSQWVRLKHYSINLRTIIVGSISSFGSI